MGMERIRYRDGYKYQLVDPYVIQTDITGYDIDHEGYIRLFSNGTLRINRTYSWDGPSGPTMDSKSSMRASLVHDSLYQLMGVEPKLLEWRLYADSLLYNILREDGMWPVRAWLWKKAVNWFGSKSAEEGDQILEAP
jgi:hypothetical protein